MTTKKATEKTAHKAPKADPVDPPTPEAPVVEAPEPVPAEFAKEFATRTSHAATSEPLIPTGPDGYEAVRQNFNVPAALGMRVQVRDRSGVIVEPLEPDTVNILFDGDDHSHLCHPTEDGVVYLDPKGGI